MDSHESIIDPHNEVRKLQELVKKLEKQNEVLRSKQSTSANNNENIQQNGDAGQNHVNSNNNIYNDNDSNEYMRNKLRDSLVLDDFDDVNFSDLPAEDDSWLFASPKQLTPQQAKEGLMTWVRQDFDHPSPEIESSRRALISRLDEVARMKHSSSSPVIGSTPVTSKSAVNLSRSTEESATPSRIALGRKSGLVAPGATRLIETGTFTRPKRTAYKAPQHGEGDQPQEVPCVPNASDIETLAKQQEESLRQSITPNRKAMRAKQGFVEGDNGARLSPSRFDVDGAYLSQHRGSLGSDHSTPPDSPHGNQYFQLNNSNDLRGRRSLPTTPGLQYKPHNSSDSSLERNSVGSDEMNLAPEAMRGPSSRVQQPNYRSNTTASSTPKRAMSGLAPGLAQQPRGMSPQRTSNLPGPRRQIMRPSSATRTSLPTYRRTNIPSPRPPSSQGSEENWREGCF